jgi:hypothetical protein
MAYILVTAVQAKGEVDERRKAAWQTYLDGRQFLFPEDYSALIWSLREFDGNAKVHIVYDPKDKGKIEYKFFRDGREVLSVQGHAISGYAAAGNDLYFTNYSTSAAGCSVVAYDLATGKKQWKTALHQAQPGGHSAYGNIVFIRLSRNGEGGGPEGSAIIVTGKESYCDYIEVLDRKTGESLAIKNYRVGFGPPGLQGGAVGVGGFGGEGRAKRSAPEKTGKK